MRTVNTSLTEFPLYFSLLSDPGYDHRKLKSFGFRSEGDFFIGRTDTDENYTKALTWSYRNTSIQSIFFNYTIYILIFGLILYIYFLGIYNESKARRILKTKNTFNDLSS